MTLDEIAIEKALAERLGLKGLKQRHNALDGYILTLPDPRDASGRTPLHITEAGGLARYLRRPWQVERPDLRLRLADLTAEGVPGTGPVAATAPVVAPATATTETAGTRQLALL